MASKIVCGDQAAVDGIPMVARWAVSCVSPDAPFQASASPHGTGRIKAFRDLTGSWEAHGGEPSVFVGDQRDFVGSIDKENGVTAKIRIERLSINIPLLSERPIITHEVRFGNDGTSIVFGAAAAEDAATPLAVPALFGKVAFSTDLEAPIFTDEADVTAIRLEFAVQTRPYVSSDTVADGYAYRLRPCKSAVDAQLTYRTLQGDPSALTLPEVPVIARVYVTDTVYWELKAMRIKEVREFGGDHEGRLPVGCEVVARFDATADGAGSGYIKLGAVNKWPEA